MAQALRRLVIGAGIFTLLAAGCGDDGGETAASPTSAPAQPTAQPTTAAPPDRPLVVATHSILGDVVGNIVGDAATVEVLMPVGSDPHDFAPSPQQASRLREADVVIANGHGFEEGLLDALEAAEKDGVDIFEAGEQVATIPSEGHGDDGHGDPHEDEPATAEAAGEEHEEGGADPHFFTDPVRMAEAVEKMTVHLNGKAEALDDQVVRERGRAYAEELRQVGEEMAETLSVVPAERRKLVTNHEVFGYFAERFDFEVIGTIVPGGTTLAEPSAQDLDELTRVIKAAGVPAIFAETSAPDRLANALAAEAVDVEVVELFTESLGPAGSEASTYIDMMSVDAQRIANALKT